MTDHHHLNGAAPAPPAPPAEPPGVHVTPAGHAARPSPAAAVADADAPYRGGGEPGDDDDLAEVREDIDALTGKVERHRDGIAAQVELAAAVLDRDPRRPDDPPPGGDDGLGIPHAVPAVPPHTVALFNPDGTVRRTFRTAGELAGYLTGHRQAGGAPLAFRGRG